MAIYYLAGILAGWFIHEAVMWAVRRQRVADAIEAENKRQLAIRSVERS